MKRIVRVISVTTAAGVAIGLAVPPALATHDNGNIHRHRHYLKLESGAFVQVGPRLCDDATLQTAFNQFHAHVHIGPNGLDHAHTPAVVTNGGLGESDPCRDLTANGN